MSQAKFGRTLLGIVFAGMISSSAFVGCFFGGGAGDTDGGQGNDAAGLGAQTVSNGGFGATLTIQLDGGGNIIQVTERAGFHVTALDPQGAPLPNQRVFCESEKGIAILEPSSNGVAFEHTGSQGIMSGVLGGVAPGSYLLECRLEEGFNLVARLHIKVEGEVPAGFAGFPGAAGGNLGGGVIVENPNPSGQLVQVTFNMVNTENSPNGPIDIIRNLDCDSNLATNDPEPYGNDNYILTINNTGTQDLIINSVTFAVGDGRGVESTEQFAGLVIAAGASGSLTGTFTEPVFLPSGAQSAIKAFAGTAFQVLHGTYNVTFTVSADTLDGNSADLQGSAAVTFEDVDRC